MSDFQEGWAQACEAVAAMLDSQCTAKHSEDNCPGCDDCNPQARIAYLSERVMAILDDASLAEHRWRDAGAKPTASAIGSVRCRTVDPGVLRVFVSDNGRVVVDEKENFVHVAGPIDKKSTLAWLRGTLGAIEEGYGSGLYDPAIAYPPQLAEVYVVEHRKPGAAEFKISNGDVIASRHAAEAEAREIAQSQSVEDARWVRYLCVEAGAVMAASSEARDDIEPIAMRERVAYVGERARSLLCEHENRGTYHEPFSVMAQLVENLAVVASYLLEQQQ